MKTDQLVAGVLNEVRAVYVPSNGSAGSEPSAASFI
jgi:hypothetical protein